MDDNQLWKTAAYGALAGVLGTFAIQAARSASRKLATQPREPLRGDPALTVIKTVEGVLPAKIREKIPQQLESVAAALLPPGYGASATAIYSAIRANPELVVDGVALGGAIWAAGYMGWLPAMGLMPAAKKQKPAEVAASLLQHFVYGVATVSAYRKLRAAMA